MNTDKLIIPTKCKVGFNTRGDTYTGKLGYIIYNDGKVWRKEPSWEDWREKYMPIEEYEAMKLDHFNSEVRRYTELFNKYKGVEKPSYNYHYVWEIVNKFDTVEEYLKDSRCDNYETFRFYIHKVSTDITINPIEFDNVPTEGFVLNKKAGGGRYSWNPRQTYCRVYDPRGWEFEITIPNLLFILECSNSMKGKGIEGEFVYSWDGKDLVLLPCNSEDFQSSKQFTELQKGKVVAKNLKIGATYIDKSGNNLLYLGKLERVKEIPNGTETYKGRYRGVYEKRLYKKVVQKSYAFYGTPSPWRHGYEVHENLSKIKSLATEVIPENFATILEGYYTNIKTKLDE